MSHPDQAWSPYYCSPAGLENDPCKHSSRRLRVAPTGRKLFSVLVDDCGYCGRILRTQNDLSWREYDWVRRWNRRLGAESFTVGGV